VPIFGLVFFVGMGVICLPVAWRFEAAWLAWGGSRPPSWEWGW